jgi:transposase-like protein
MEKTVKTLSQIAAEYGIHISTLRRWITPIREDLKLQNRKLLLPWQIEMIYDYLKKPF